MRAQEFIFESTQSPAEVWIDKVYSQYPDWPYGQADKAMVWGSGDEQTFAAFKLKPGADPQTVEIDWLMAGPEQRKGVGSRAIKELQQQAQADGIHLTLYPWGKGRISQASLSKLYKRHGFKPIAKGAKPMRWSPELDEGWRSALAGAAAAGAMAMSPNVAAKPTAISKPAVTAKAPAAKVAAAPKHVPVSKAEQARMTPIQKLKTAASANGIHGTELAQFLAQCAHESANFTRMEEIGSSKYFTKKYDPEYSPKTAKILGNVEPGDGERYKGRGFIQLTGRDNYRMAGKALNLPLEANPELAARPDVAAVVAVWFWKNRVASKVKNFANTKQATKPINPALKGLEQRQEKFKQYQMAMR